MARTNKYSSINFNEIYDKKINTTKSSSSAPATSSQKTLQNLSTSRIHGGMLVLTRPTPKPQPHPQLQPQPNPSPPPPPPAQLSKTSSPVPDQTGFVPDSTISLRPLGRTGSSLPSSSSPIPITLDKERESTVSTLHSPKPEPFVPPHLRPGFAGKEERLVQEGQKILGFRSREFGHKQGHQVGSPNRYDEDGRPKSGGYERIPRGGDSDQDVMNRPSSSGNRPSSSGNRYGSSSYRSPHHF
ncbi:hypothetical protein BVC80_8687g4 [Macleaya cordata]|uniref:Uncharacterized protein n=1 Tax=Macleaya cordata TaxID=56857 RepID=A0A200QL93_MACCD|nr:hypothetical protein BVC80_8687g4 [Macleaya cordata]